MGLNDQAYRELRKLIDRVRAVGSPAFADKVAKAMGAQAVTLVSQGFRKEQDPYGKPWAPLKHRDGRILVDTARMRNAFHFRAEAGNVRLINNVGYTRHHQDGTGRIRRRQMVPTEADGGLGPIWGGAFNRAADGLMRRHLKGQG